MARPTTEDPSGELQRLSREVGGFHRTGGWLYRTVIPQGVFDS